MNRARKKPSNTPRQKRLPGTSPAAWPPGHSNLPAEPAQVKAPDWTIFGSRFRVGPTYAVKRTTPIREHLLLLTESGRGWVASRGATREVGPGTLVVLYPGHPHSYGTHPDSPNWDFLWAHVFPPPDWHLPAPNSHLGPGIGLVDVADTQLWKRACKAFSRSLDHFYETSSWHQSMALNAVEEALLWIGHGATGEFSTDPRIRKVKEAISADPSRSRSVTEMAKIAGLSASHFSHLFQEQTGTTPLAFQEDARLQFAALLLRAGGWRVSEAAAAAGFSCPFYFSRRFRHRFGKSPSQAFG